MLILTVPLLLLLLLPPGDACVKWTDKWAERLLPGGAREQWGDKWHEAFANGRGEKNGEVRAGQSYLLCLGCKGCAFTMMDEAKHAMGGILATYSLCHVCFPSVGPTFVCLLLLLVQVWSVGAGGERYQRWWGEQHLGDRRVRRHGHSTTGG